MIVAERKPLPEILGMLGQASRVLVAGCSECVAVCHAGGEREVRVLASALRINASKSGRSLTVKTLTVQRQCDPEFVETVDPHLDGVEVAISMACGVGVQFLAERLKEKKIWVIPGVNTKFGGGAVAPGIWEERCGFCGDCILWRTGGICPVIRCSKSLLNGPCGGSQGGKCEVSKDIPCAWQLIYDRLKELGRLDLILEPEPAKDWSLARDGGPRKVVREDLTA